MQFGKAHVQVKRRESHYSMTASLLKTRHKQRQWRGNIINATMLWSTQNETYRHQKWQNERYTEYNKTKVYHSLNDKLTIDQMYYSCAI